MKIAITGGSGFIGTNYIDFLIDLPDVKILNLDIVAPRCSAHSKYWIYCDVLNLQHLSKCLYEFQPNFIVNLAADTGVGSASLQQFRTNFDGIENLISASKDLSSLNHVVFASSLLVCKVGYVPISDTDFCPSTPYGQSKMMGENIVRSACSDSFTWTIIRAISIWGPWNFQPYLSFFKSILSGWYFHIGTGHYKRSLGYVGNTVRQIHSILISDRELTHRRTLYIADLVPADLHDMADQICSLSGSPRIRYLPLFLAKLIARIGDLFSALGWRSVPLTSFRLNNICTEYIFDLSPISSICKYDTVSIKQGIILTLKHLNVL